MKNDGLAKWTCPGLIFLEHPPLSLLSRLGTKKLSIIVRNRIFGKKISRLNAIILNAISRLNVTINQSRVTLHRISRANQLHWRNLIGRLQTRALKFLHWSWHLWLRFPKLLGTQNLHSFNGSSPKYRLKSLSDWLIIGTAGFWLANRKSP